MSQSMLSPQNRQRRFILLAGLLFLFFFQLLSDFVAGIYAFGLLGTGIPNEIISVLFLFSPLLLFFFKDRIKRGWLIGFAGLGLVCRFVEVMLDTRGQMLVSGQRAPILGRVCMDQTLIDVGHIPEVAVEDEVVVFGSQNDESISVDEIAADLNTINYEIVSALTARVPRVYRE